MNLVVRAFPARDRPRVPLRARRVFAKKRPRRLVGEEHGLVEELGAETVVGRPEHARESFDLVVERLRIDEQTLAPHDLHLALKRQVVSVFRYGDANREGEAVAAARDEAWRHRRRLDAFAAAASVLLANVFANHEFARDDVDLFGLLGLTRHLFERAFAQHADAVGFGDLVGLFDDPKLRLLARAVALLRRALLRLRLLVAFAFTTFGALSEEHPILLLELRLKRPSSSTCKRDAVLALSPREACFVSSITRASSRRFSASSRATAWRRTAGSFSCSRSMPTASL